jgi:glutamine cyclotransferase
MRLLLKNTFAPGRKLIGAVSQIAALLFLIACGAGTESARTEDPQKSPGPQTARTSTAGNNAQPDAKASMEEVPVYTYKVVNSWPHHTGSFTQGLVFHDGYMYESTGQYGSSVLCRIELESGKIKKKVELDKEYFAEGMTIFGDKVYQLTWQSQRGFVYELKNFKRVVEFTYEGEGWGLTNDGQSLIMSDGTHKLRFLDPRTFRVLRTLEVYDHGQPLMQLNELEYVKGEIYANIWHSEKIVRIDPASGKILAWIDLTGLRKPEDGEHTDNVLNGIAYDEKTDRLFVTGKRWTRVYEIQLIKKDN